MFQAGGLVVVLVEVIRKSYLASIVPVIVDGILNAHQLVVDIVAFVARGDFPRSRLGEKQRGKILSGWVSRKMRTLAQFGIRDSEHVESHMNAVTRTPPHLAPTSVRNGSLVASSLSRAHSLAESQQGQRDYAPLPTGISEMPADFDGAPNDGLGQGINGASGDDRTPTDVHTHRFELPDTSTGDQLRGPPSITTTATLTEQRTTQPSSNYILQDHPHPGPEDEGSPQFISSLSSLTLQDHIPPQPPAKPGTDGRLGGSSTTNTSSSQAPVAADRISTPRSRSNYNSDNSPSSNRKSLGGDLWTLPSQKPLPAPQTGGLRAVNMDPDDIAAAEEEEEWPQEALMHMHYGNDGAEDEAIDDRYGHAGYENDPGYRPGGYAAPTASPSAAHFSGSSSAAIAPGLRQGQGQRAEERYKLPPPPPPPGHPSLHTYHQHQQHRNMQSSSRYGL